MKPDVHVLKEGRFIRFLCRDTWEYIERKNCTGIVIILAVTAEQRILFVEQYRAPVGKRMVEYPAGLANDIPSAKKESLLTAAKRELLEETGYRAAKWEKIFFGPVSGGFSADMVTIFLAREIQKVGAGGGDHTEGITVHEILLSKAEDWLERMKKKGYLVGPTIYAGLYFITKYNKTKL